MGDPPRAVGEPSPARKPQSGVRARERLGESIRGRYQLHEVLGKGGMARVYRATDVTSGRELAVKQLAFDAEDKDYATHASLFELEFRTLAQLSHPGIVDVYDFGIDECGPYYTMELLDGGDLRSRASLPWRNACAVAYAICSSLALVHSRRLVHRDVTPNNVRFTRDGRAKLIDFGAMVPMGAGSLAVGTPQFSAPEVVLRTNLDARTDLFSLGATLYYALTRAAPYPGRHAGEVAKAWEIKPLAPSRRTEDVPEALDALVLALLSIEPAARPRTAFEVMQRLVGIAGTEDAEPPQVSRAYLSTPTMVGRDAVMARIVEEAKRAVGQGGRSVLVEASAGLGRSAVLDATALLAKTLGARVLRASATATGTGAFQLAERLAAQLVVDVPDVALAAARAENVADVLFEPADDGQATEAPKLRAFRSSGRKRYALQNALCRWLLRVSGDQPLTIAVDDVKRADEPSVALLAALATELEQRRILLVLTAESDSKVTDPLAFEVLARQSIRLTLPPLSRADTKRLFESVFGDVPNVEILSERVYEIAGGNPRDAMELAQHLSDRGTLAYERGVWTLPARIDPSDLPRDVQESMQARLKTLSPLARWLAEAQALATSGAFKRDDYGKLRADATTEEIDAAVGELVARRIVTSDGRLHSIVHAGWNGVLLRDLAAEDQAARHRALVSVYAGKLRLGVVQHALLAGLFERALDELSPVLSGLPEATNLYELTDLDALEVAELFERALDAAERVGRSALEINHLRRWLMSLSVVSDDKYYFRVGPAWLERLKRDSGFDDWKERADVADPKERLSLAMQSAFARYATTPEAERAYRPDEAVQALVHFVGISMAVGSSRLDLAITESLPPLLEPFAGISPFVELIWQNATATCESSCRSQTEKAHARWVAVYDGLSRLTGVDPAMVGVFQRAVAYAIGANEATMGIATAATWADLLDADPAQKVNGLYIRRIVRLQEGDLEGAERCRKEAEIVGLKARARQMFTHLTWVELITCGLARDLTGIRQCEQRVRALATRSSAWTAYLRLAEAYSALCSDDFDAARVAFAAAVALTETPKERPFPLPSAWCTSAAGLVETLVALGDSGAARRTGESALALCHERGIGAAAYGISRALAVAEANLGAIDAARARVDAVISAQTALGVKGLHLGASYEARARVALAAGDGDDFARYAALASREYRHGKGSALGARFQRLLHDGARLLPAGAAASASQTVYISSSRLSSGVVAQLLKTTRSAEDRAECALRLLCEAANTTSGYLYVLETAGIRIAASCPRRDPPNALTEFVRRIDACKESEEGTTELVTGPLESLRDTTVFVDADGRRYRAVPLFGSMNGAMRHVATAALLLGDDPKAIDQDVTLAVGTHLGELL
ncbi:MAG TPA: protein kinase [Polyangiaceae bacterium]|nr:protein kinase [Polyangiaceae bacterium]